MKAPIAVLCALAALAVLVAPTVTGAPTKDEAIQNLKQLNGSLRTSKNDGDVGEVHNGYVAAVKGPSGAIASLIEKVNANRKAIYAALAKQHGIPLSRVETNAGVRNFRDANSGDYLKPRDGRWRKKK